MRKRLAVLILAGWILGLAPGPLLCDDQILPIHSVPDPKPAEAVQPPGQPDFHGKGQVYRIGKDEVGKSIIVIDDRLKYFAKNVAFYDPDGNPLKFSDFYKGNMVGYMLDTENRITSLYLLEK